MEIYSKKRAYWASRRGMLELDIILKQFIDQQYDQLTTSQQTDITYLLHADDPDIFTWLMGYGQPKDEKLKRAVELIRTYHHETSR